MRPTPWLLAALVVPLACGRPEGPLTALRYSSVAYPYTAPVRLYVGQETDRSGGEYSRRVADHDLPGLRERISHHLQARILKLDTYTAAGNPTTVRLRNPFVLVADSTQADVVLRLRVDGWEEGAVEVTRDRVLLWNSYGITRYYVGIDRVPRVLVALDVHLVDTRTGEVFYGLQARGVAVGGDFRRQGYDLALARCAARLCEKFLSQG